VAINDELVSPWQARAIMQRIGQPEPVTLDRLKQRNHVYRLRCGDGTFFLKLYTKDWYGPDPAATGFCVAHEASAWACLAAHGLSAPEVVLPAADGNNPLGRPFLLTRALAGDDLTTHLAQQADPGPLLRAVGAYLRRMHAIAFAYPGYIVCSGPTAPPAAGAWHHRCWTAAARQRHALAILEREKGQLSPALVQPVEERLGRIEEALAPAYQPPRFTHGDCHAHQFFLVPAGDGWQVTGVVDLEVASAGDCGEDLLKLGIELAAVLAPATRWWEALFDGYGGEPSFALHRLRLLGTSPAEFEFAARGWPSP
jgi:aminoglycoside phosphotransferase